MTIWKCKWCGKSFELGPPSVDRYCSPKCFKESGAEEANLQRAKRIVAERRAEEKAKEARRKREEERWNSLSKEEQEVEIEAKRKERKEAEAKRQKKEEEHYENEVRKCRLAGLFLSLSGPGCILYAYSRIVSGDVGVDKGAAMMMVALGLIVFVFGITAMIAPHKMKFMHEPFSG
jgi:Flp pilus assembly protein TadB